jgi:hypothetical protein
MMVRQWGRSRKHLARREMLTSMVPNLEADAEYER